MSREQAEGCVLVVDGAQFVGIFTGRDVVKLIGAGTDLSQTKIEQVIAQPAISLTLTGCENVLTALSFMRQHRIRYLPLVDERGQLVGLVTQEQIDRLEEQLERETAFQQEQNYWQAVFENALDAITIADDEGRYVDANPAACALFGVSREELLRSRVADFADPNIDVAQMWQQFLQQGQMSGDFCLHRPDGTTRETEFNAIAFGRLLPGASPMLSQVCTSQFCAISAKGRGSKPNASKQKQLCETAKNAIA
ncbi:MAG: PAS domain S-box protein [Cyanobacteria bacterium CRU_2_1]|nr:PAS domain S-box protein [Cyanobacteria bacterium CRU_2_1]